MFLRILHDRLEPGCNRKQVLLGRRSAKAARDLTDHDVRGSEIVSDRMAETDDDFLVGHPATELSASASSGLW